MPRHVVTVDAFSLSSPSSYRGIGTYLREVLQRLPSDPDLAVRALVTDPAVLPSGVEPVRIRRVAPGRYRGREHEVWLPHDLRRAGGDVVWSPAQDPPRRSRAPFVQTLLDVTPLLHPHPHHGSGAERLRRLAPRYRAAAAWVAISGYTADTAATALDLPRDRITVTHLAAHPRFRPAAGSRPRRPPSTPPYVLYVGEYGPHKGFADAFAVAAGLADAGLPHRVRMVGRIAPWWRPAIDALLDAAPRPDLVDLVGYADDVVAEYQGADALIMTSRHEGFGLPLVEAMACAVPVVSYDNSSLPEVVGGGGALVADGDVGALVDALVPLLGSDDAWAAAANVALDRSAAFSWAMTAAGHADLLRSVAAQA